MNGEDRLPAASELPAEKCSAAFGATSFEARRLLDLADGFEAGVHAANDRPSEAALVFPRLARFVARTTLQLAGELEVERSARVAVQAERDRLDALLVTYRSRLAARQDS
jgi:hypothetical protein